MSYISSQIIRRSLLPSIKNGAPLTKELVVLAVPTYESDGRVLPSSVPLDNENPVAVVAFRVWLPPNARIYNAGFDCTWTGYPA